MITFIWLFFVVADIAPVILDRIVIFVFRDCGDILLFAFLYTGAASVPFTAVPLLINAVRNELKLGVLRKDRAESIAAWNTIIVWIVVAYLTYRADYDPTYSVLPFILYLRINRTILKGEVCLKDSDCNTEAPCIEYIVYHEEPDDELYVFDRFCRSCGNKPSEDSLYCNKCGSSVVRMKSNGQPADIYLVGSEENTMNDRRS